MNVYHNLTELPAFRNAVLTIGSFDGVHKGHQKILQRVNQLAAEKEGESVVITFHPHPRLVLRPDDNSLQLLNTIDEKVRLLETYDIDNVVVVRFTPEFSSQSAQEYIEDFLIGRFSPACIVIGYDHKFGKDRQGNIELLRQYATDGAFEIVEIKKQEVEDITVSSSKVRLALSKGDVHTAAQLMGHYFTLTGSVVRGQSIGRSLGFPTANLDISNKHKLIPPRGIYAVRVIHQQQRFGGMLYIGTRPTLDAYTNRTIEVNIFDFDKDIYGDQVQVEFVDFIRHETQLNGLEALKLQLAQDKKDVLEILKKKRQSAPKAPAPTQQASVAVVILNYNGRQYLESFLPSLQNSSYSNAHIIIADNCSTDDSVDWLQAHFPDIQLICMDENRGFAGGYNEAIRQIEKEYDYHVLLNSDVEVSKDWIEPIVELMEKDPSIGACQPKIRSFRDRPSFEYAGAAGGWIDYLGYPFCRGRIFSTLEVDNGQYDDVSEVFWASGTAIFVRPKLMKSLGGFDADYFAHLEEIDLCWRIQRAGYKVMVQPRSIVYHVGGGTLDYQSPYKAYLNFRNSLITLLKNEPASKLLWLIPLRLVLDGLAGLLFISEGKFQHLRSILRAHGTFYRTFGRSLRKRKKYQDRIEKASIQQQPNPKGVYRHSIVLWYYLLRKRKFKDLRNLYEK
ncbi:MAG: bifunctional riboflavin kinase/FAD synthetase [Bacteroidota bacterium]